jgi:hypothetical protein
MIPHQKTLNRLEYLESLYRQGYQSEVVDRSLEKIISIEKDEAQQKLTELEQRLQAYEIQYHLSSAEFYQRFQAGEMGDEVDFVEWSIFYEMYASAQKCLETLQNQLT